VSSSYNTGTNLTVAELRGWALAAVMLLTLVLEVVDLVRNRPVVAPVPEPVTALACWESCAWGGGAIASWSPLGCECAPRKGGEP
jgi:hypothetical protein